MKKIGIVRYLPNIAASLVGCGIIISVLNPDFKATLTSKFNKEGIESTIENAHEYIEDRVEDTKEFFGNLYETTTEIFKKEDKKTEVIETIPTYNVFPLPDNSTENTSVESEVEDTTEVAPVVEETVIYDEYTDTYLLDHNYEFKDIDVEAYNEENSDYVGYLDVPGTTMDYPVYQRENDETNDYYLHRDRNERKYYPGEIYAHSKVDLSLGDDSSTIQNTTITLFGHNMGDWRDDKKFCDLKNFKSQSYLDEHPYGVYYSEDGSVYALEIVAGYKVSDGRTEKDFMIFNLDDMTVFNNYVDFINENAIVKTDVELEYGDKIVNLVSCTHKEKGDQDPKYIVVCKAVKQYTDVNQITNSEGKTRKLTK